MTPLSERLLTILAQKTPSIGQQRRARAKVLRKRHGYPASMAHALARKELPQPPGSHWARVEAFQVQGYSLMQSEALSRASLLPPGPARARAMKEAAHPALPPPENTPDEWEERGAALGIPGNVVRGYLTLQRRRGRAVTLEGLREYARKR
jgi:hypothetical protein